MGIVSWVVIGLIVGLIAQAILPGRTSGGFVVTLVVGLVGAVLGGFIGAWIFDVNIGGFWNVWTWLFSLVGAIIVVWLVGWAQARNKKRG